MFLNTVSDAIKENIVGTVGEIINAPGMSSDARKACLDSLFNFIAEVTFYRRDKDGRVIPFKIKKECMYDEWPDNEQELEMPCLAVIPGRGVYLPVALSTWVDITTYNKYAPNSVVQVLNTDYQEDFVIEVMAASKGERRAVLNGMLFALSPTEEAFGLKLKLPNYFDEVAYFTPNAGSIVDDAESARNRRKGQIEVSLSIPLLRLVDAVKLIPAITVQTTVQGEVLVETDVAIETG